MLQVNLSFLIICIFAWPLILMPEILLPKNLFPLFVAKVIAVLSIVLSIVFLSLTSQRLSKYVFTIDFGSFLRIK